MTINEKLMNIQAQLKAPKDKKNTFGGYSYRSCESILESVKPLLAAQKCTLVLSDEITNVGDRYYVKATASFSDGENSIVNTALAREAEVKKGMDESQITGTASSYARKYALNGLFAIDDTKDADTDEFHRTTAPAKAISCESCGATLTDLTKRNGELWPASDIAEYAKARYGKVLCPACMKAAEKK